MSGEANRPLGSAVAPTERVKARRCLLGALTIFLALIVLDLELLAPYASPRDLFSFIWHFSLLIFAAALFFLGYKLQRSQPSGSNVRLNPRYIRGNARNLRGIARIADVPELGAVIMIYAGLIVAMIFSTVVFVISAVSLFS